MKLRILYAMAAIVTAICIGIAWGGTTGKIAGVVSDENGNPIPGASIRIDSTSMGAAAGIDGSYIILNVPPGKYNLLASAVGYNKVTMENVVVKADSTSEVKIILKPSNIMVSDIVVTAEQKTIDKYITGNETRKSAEQIAQMPIGNIGDAIRSSPGLVREGNNLHARGSRQGGISYLVNGCVISDPLGSIRYPSDNWNTENYNRIYENRFFDSRDNPLSTFSVDVDPASYSNARRFITDGQFPPVDAIRIEEFINYFKYDYPQPLNDDPFSLTTEISDCPWNQDHRLLLIGLQGKNVPLENLPPSNLVFLIDVSGSMEDENKLPLLKRAFLLLVDQLRPQDRVAIVVYAGAAGLVLQSTPGTEKDKMRDAINMLEAGGSTAGGAGIRLAYEVARQNFITGGNNRVILATDGDFNIGVSSDAEMIKLIEEKREGGVFLSVLGFGEGNLKDSRMEQIADKGNGNYSYIDNIMEARKVFVSQMAGTLFTIAKDVKLQIEFNPTKVKAYRLIGYENRILAKEDFNDDKKDAGEMGSGHTVTALYEIIPAGAIENTSNLAPLKYQQTTVILDSYQSRELLTINIRFKKPDGVNSTFRSFPVLDRDIAFAKSSDNFRFASAVAEFGLILRGSEFKGDATYEQILSLAGDARGKDSEGYRAEFVRLVQTCQSMPVISER